MRCNSHIIRFAYIKATEDEVEISEGRNYQLVLISVSGHVQNHYFTTYRRASEMKQYYWDRGYMNVYK